MGRLMTQLRALWAYGGWSMGIFALGTGVVAAWSMQHYLANRIADIQASTRVQTVVRLVAAHDLLAGDALSEDSVATRAVPTQWAGSDGLAPEHFETWEGSVLVHGLSAGEQILATYLRARQPQSLASTLTPGRRAVSIALDDGGAQTAFLRPGNSVDIYVTHDFEGRVRTHLLLQGMKVLTVGTHADEDEAEPSTTDASVITLDASMPEAARLVAARQTGRLAAVLRSDSVAVRNDSMVALPADLQIALGLIARPRVIERRHVPVLYGTEDARAAQTGSSGNDAAENVAW